MSGERCTNCKKLEWELEETKHDLEVQQRANRSLNAKLRHVQNKLNEYIEGSPLLPAVQRVWDHYLVALSKTGGRKPTLDDERTELIDRAIRDFTEERCMRAIDGLAYKPYAAKMNSGKYGRSHKPAEGFDRKDDIKYALKTAERLERCEGYADERDRLINDHINPEAIFDYWGSVHCAKQDGDQWTFSCPKCSEMTLKVTGGRADWVCQTGCTLREIALALREHRDEREAA